jgi:phosphomannomutase/phosphoglucomutase
MQGSRHGCRGGWGWGLVRASNTQAVLVLRFEAETEAQLDAIQKEVKGSVERAIHKLERS